jgi:hypothetical protein
LRAISDRLREPNNSTFGKPRQWPNRWPSSCRATRVRRKSHLCPPDRTCLAHQPVDLCAGYRGARPLPKMHPHGMRSGFDHERHWPVLIRVVLPIALHIPCSGMCELKVMEPSDATGTGLDADKVSKVPGNTSPSVPRWPHVDRRKRLDRASCTRVHAAAGSGRQRLGSRTDRRSDGSGTCGRPGQLWDTGSSGLHSSWPWLLLAGGRWAPGGL